MAKLPDFSDDDRARLKELGVGDEQITRLRYVIPIVEMIANPANYAPKADVMSILDEISNLSGKLSKKLEALVVPKRDAAHGVAYGLVEEGYWQGDRWADSGPSVAAHLVPRLQALRNSAVAAKARLPQGPSRRRTADPRAVRHIHEALRQGWRDAQRRAPERSEEAARHVSTRLQPYPKGLVPSKAENSPFREIVGLCYRKVGATADPRAAIENYLSEERKIRADLRNALDEGLRVTERSPRGRKPGQ